MQVIDIRNTKAFPNTSYRYAGITNTGRAFILSRDPLGENPLHYYSSRKGSKEILLVASNIRDIKTYLDGEGLVFSFDRVRAVSNGQQVFIDNDNPTMATVIMDEVKLRVAGSVDVKTAAGIVFHGLKEEIRKRMETIEEGTVGLLLSGGLDSGSIGYFLSQASYGKKVVAFTLKVNENDSDVQKSRWLAEKFGFELIEVKVQEQEGKITVSNSKEELATGMEKEDIVKDVLRTCAHALKDNVFCAISMHLIAMAIQKARISTVFCGEGPNEMINDYGIIPERFGYGSTDPADQMFRWALTFGIRQGDIRLGRGGLGKHAILRMHKIFAQQGLRLESPYFNQEIAKTMIRIPHGEFEYEGVKPVLVREMLREPELEEWIKNASKEKFQDGSGISRIFSTYSQKRLNELLDEVYPLRHHTAQED